MLSGFIEIERERKLSVLVKKGRDRAIRIYGTLGPPAYPPVYALPGRLTVYSPIPTTHQRQSGSLKRTSSCPEFDSCRNAMSDRGGNQVVVVIMTYNPFWLGACVSDPCNES